MVEGDGRIMSRGSRGKSRVWDYEMLKKLSKVSGKSVNSIKEYVVNLVKALGIPPEQVSLSGRVYGEWKSSWERLEEQRARKRGNLA